MGVDSGSEDDDDELDWSDFDSDFSDSDSE